MLPTNGYYLRSIAGTVSVVPPVFLPVVVDVGTFVFREVNIEYAFRILFM